MIGPIVKCPSCQQVLTMVWANRQQRFVFPNHIAKKSKKSIDCEQSGVTQEWRSRTLHCDEKRWGT